MKCTLETKEIPFTGSTGIATLTENTATVVFPGITRTYTMIQLSDLHIADYNEGDTEEDIRYVKHEIEMWGNQSVPVDDGSGIVTHSVIPIDTLVIERINSLHPDAVLVCGDIADTGTKTTYRKTKDVISKLTPPTFLTPGNHERVTARTPAPVAEAFAALYGKVEPVMTYRVGEVKIISLNSSFSAFTDEQRMRVEAELCDGTPSLIFTHIPFFTDHLLSVTNPEWAEYFLAGNDKHDEPTKRFAAMIREKKPLVIAGHTHTKLDFPDEEPLQLISTPAFTGYYRIIKLVPETKTETID